MKLIEKVAGLPRLRGFHPVEKILKPLRTARRAKARGTSLELAIRSLPKERREKILRFASKSEKASRKRWGEAARAGLVGGGAVSGTAGYIAGRRFTKKSDKKKLPKTKSG